MAVPHLDDGIVSEILCRLPTKAAYRLAAVCRQWRAVLWQPTFLCRHLSPRALPDRPYALIVQPLGEVGFTDLMLVNIPLKPEYTARGYDRFAPQHPATWPMEIPPLQVEVEDYAVFFERTVQTLNVSVVASHGRLLLCHSPSRYYVCDPAANRWLALPPATVLPSRSSAGLHYDVVDASRFVFTIVLLARRRRRRVLVQTFSSTTGRWASMELAASGVARCLPAKSPGIHDGTCFYWHTRRFGGGQSRILRYDTARCQASKVREPPLAKDAKRRVSRSLGSVGGRLRLCAFDITADDYKDHMEAVRGVWLMDAASEWRRVQAVVVKVSVLVLIGAEAPVDFASACDEFILLKKLNSLLRYDLESGSKLDLADLPVGCQSLYFRYNVFPFFK